MPTMINSNKTTLKYITVKVMKTRGKKNLKSREGKTDFMGRRPRKGVKADFPCKAEQARGPCSKAQSC